MWFTNWPNFHITISGSVLAGYAAVLSTITGAAQLWNYNRDRARIKITAQDHMQLYDDSRYKNQTLVIVTVANLGRHKPLTAHLLPVKNKHAGDTSDFDNPYLTNATLQPMP